MEIKNQLQQDVNNIYCQTSNGSSVSGLHLGFRQLWVNEEIQNLPKINAVSTSNGNAIVVSYNRKKQNIMTLEKADIKESRYNRNVINLECFNGQDALNTMYDTEGKAIGVSDEELVEYTNKFRKLERIRLSVNNAYPIAALFKESNNGALDLGNHVLVLNDGRVNINVRDIRRDDLKISYEQFLEKLDDWLIQFSDPIEEIQEAVDDAFENGFVICAYQNEMLVGITIVSTSKYDTFFPKYHLSYVATKKDIKGMGIATQLIQKVIDLTGGDFSLHVETDNKRAIRLYEKMGLSKKYYRMFYRGDIENNV